MECPKKKGGTTLLPAAALAGKTERQLPSPQLPRLQSRKRTKPRKTQKLRIKGQTGSTFSTKYVTMGKRLQRC